jgi:hypothetical protein
MPMGYEQAATIRQSGYLNEVSKNLLKDKSVKESFKSSFSDVTRAKAMGIKEKFDPLNIAKKLSFGSSIGPALLGTLTGRSKEDIEYFTGIKSKKSKSTKLPKTVGDTESSKTILDKLYVMFKEQADEEKQVRELKSDSAEAREVLKQKNHKEVIGILESIGKSSVDESSVSTESEGVESSIVSLLKGLVKGRLGKGGLGKGGLGKGGLGKFEGLFKRGRGSRGGKKPPTKSSPGPGIVPKIIIGSGLGLTALLSKAEAKSYDTVFGDQSGITTPKPLTQMTLKEVDEFQRKPGLKSSAVGKYQIMRETLIGAKKALNLKDSDIFSIELQDRIFTQFLIGSKAGREKLNAYLSGKTDDSQKLLEEAQLQLAQEFAGVPVPFDVVRPRGTAGQMDPGGLVKRGESYYGGVGQNKKQLGTTVEETQQRLREQRDLNSGKLKP